MRNRITIIFCLGIAFALASQILSADTLTSDHYAQTLAGLDSLAAKGISSADLYYNQGVCHYQTGNLGGAVLAYLRALNIDSAHRQARENLAYIMSTHPELPREPSRPYLVQLSLRILDFFNLNRLSLALLAAALLLTLSLHWLLHYPQDRERGLPVLAVMVAALLFVGSGSVLLAKYHRYRHNPKAVVMADMAAVYAAEANGRPLQTLPAGSIVVLGKMSGNRIRVILPDDTGGWIDANSAERVVPNR
jgi:tetratricopeptide (TPR) repeat protein